MVDYEVTYEETDPHLARQRELESLDSGLYRDNVVLRMIEENDFRIGLNEVPSGSRGKTMGEYLTFLEQAQYLSPDAVFKNTDAKRNLLSEIGIRRLKGGNVIELASPSQIGRVFQNHYATAEKVMLEHGRHLVE